MNNYCISSQLLLLTTIATTTLWPVTQVLSLSCTFDPDLNSKWRFCDCKPVTVDSGQVFCRRMAWITVPHLPDWDRLASLPNGHTAYSITSLSVVDGSLAFLNQDAFKGQNIQLLDLSQNQIDTVNVNAFRGLESKLFQLSLNQNSLSTVPSRSLTYLYQLQYLYLQHNRITEITTETFEETQLKNLQFLHLDHNFLSYIPEKTFSKLPLQVLTLGSNRISSIEQRALPNSLWFLDLKNNALNTIPYKALEGINVLATLDLEGNNVTKIVSEPNVIFEKEISLKLSNNRIESIDPDAFNSFRRFKELDLSYNRIDNLPSTAFDSISQLRQLDLSYNYLANLHKTTFQNVGKTMQKLVLEENEFHALPPGLKPLRVLEHLNLNNNKLTQLDNDTFDNFKAALTNLHLAFNRLTEIPTGVLHGMSKLQHLDLSRNRIKSIDKLAFGTFDGAGTSLMRLNLAGNQIERIADPGAFLYMTALAYLDMSHNQIKELSAKAFARLTGLESVFLQNNQLPSFPHEALKSLAKLRYLVLDSNKIMALPDGSLNGLSQLERLSLGRNQIYAIGENSFPASIVGNLKSLNLAYNKVTHLSTNAFHGLTNLEQLLLNNNQLTTLNAYAFYNLSNLIQLNLAHNYINTTFQLALANLPRLEKLSLAHNNLERLERGTLSLVKKLEYLNLKSNHFKSFDLDFLGPDRTSLKTLDISDNPMSHMSFQSVKRSLNVLKISGNKLQTVGKDTFSDFERLHSLDLSRNGLIDVQPGAFVGSPKLTELTLSQNYLKIVWKGTFAHQEMYSSLDLSKNMIELLEADTFGIDNIHSLDLSNNRLQEIPYNALNSIRNSLGELILSGNKISSLESTYFNGLRNLTSLTLANNVIHTIEEAAFRGLHKLNNLNLAHNPVTTWDPQAFKDLSHSIEDLNLADTGLFSLPQLSHRGLRYLNLSSNGIYQLNAKDFEPLRKLISIDLSFNNLNGVSAELFTHLFDLRHLNLSGNPFPALVEEHFRTFHRLETLHVHSLPNLVNIPKPTAFSSLRHLRHLQLYDLPRVKELNATEILNNLPPLKSLHIEIKEEKMDRQLYTADCRMMRELTISGHDLKSLDAGAFAPLRGYRMQLGVTQTSITTFPDSIFRTLTTVSYLSLDLRDNKLRTLDPFPYTEPPVLNQHGTILQSLKLSGNPIRCDCRLKWISKWLAYLKSHSPDQSYRDVVADLRKVECYGLVNVSPIDVNFARIGCTNGDGAQNAATGAEVFAESRRIGVLSLLLLNFAVIVMSLPDFVTNLIAAEGAV